MKRGSKLLQKLDPLTPQFDYRDVLQVIVGASILSIPVGFTKEAWDLGGNLPVINILGLLLLSIIFIAMFTHYHYHKHLPKHHTNIFIKRVIATYLIAFIIVAIILTLIGVAPWGADSILALKRTIIVAFPSSLSGAIADTIK